MDKLFFDIESTGLSTETDRIIQLAIMVVSESGKILVDKAKMYNPGIPISKTAEEAHGIKDEDVEDCPKFSSDAKKLKKLFEDKIIVGYNIMRFDVPLLLAEFKRAKVEVDLSGKFIDVLNVEKKLNSNKLADAYFRYTGNKLTGAHDAMNDVRATKTIFDAQGLKLCLTTVDQLKGDSLEETFYELSGTKEMVDIYNKLKRDKDGYLIFNFGKNKDHRIIDEKNYSQWMLDNEFPTQVKALIREEQTKHALGGPKLTVQISDEEARGLHFGMKKVSYDKKEKGWTPVNDDCPF